MTAAAAIVVILFVAVCWLGLHADAHRTRRDITRRWEDHK